MAKGNYDEKKDFDKDGDNDAKDKAQRQQDLDGNGKLSPQERQAYKATEPDTVSRKVLSDRYGFSLDVIYSNKELKELFLRAVDKEKGQWTPEKFIAELKSTDWWQKGTYWRTAYVAEKTGVDWTGNVETASEVIRRRATATGATLSDKEVGQLARRYLYGGWADGNRGYLLDDALSRYITGSIADTADTEALLRQYAYEYGVQQMYDDSWYTSAMKSIARGDSSLEGWQQTVRDTAKSKYAPFAPNIDSGQSTRQAVKPYLSSMSSILELDESSLSLDDPLLRQAWVGQMDEKGQPKNMTLFDFEKSLRKDPRWQSTKNGRQSTMNTAQSFLQSLGFVS